MFMNLEEYLEKTCATKSAFARKLDVTYETILKIVNGDAYPSAKLAQRIVKLTNGEVTFEDLFKERN